MKLSNDLEQNIKTAKTLLPIGVSFDLINRELLLGSTKAYFLGINGFCRTELLQKIFAELQNPLYMTDPRVENIVSYMQARIGYAQVSLESDWDNLLTQLLSGPILLLIDGFDRAIVIDARSYPTRGIEEPDTEHVTRGARDGFVETMLFNTNLIRRRIRSPKLTFEIARVGTDSRTDVSIAYIRGLAEENLLTRIRESLAGLQISALTMGAKSLEELLLPKSWLHPLPSMHITERPDVACSYLLEGHVLLIVDNSPAVLILPSSIFQFTQSPEDYYSSPIVGNYFRLVRFFCIPVSLLLMPFFLLLSAYFPDISQHFQLLASGGLGKLRLFFYVLAVEFLLDLFKYSSAHSPNRFSGSLAIVGGLIIGDMAVELNWASVEVLFYAAITLLTSLSLTSIEFADGLRIYRIFLIVVTGLFGVWGFGLGIVAILFSVATTPTFGGMSYLWPLLPFNRKALSTLLFRYPTPKAQPGSVWKRNA